MGADSLEGTMNDCVRHNMSILSGKKPFLNRRQRLAKAFKMCNESEDFQVIHDFAEEFRTDFDPMDLLDQDTGLYIRGKPNIADTNQKMLPVISEDVKGMAVFGSELIVQFHNTKGSYRYQLDTNDRAQTVYKQFYTAGSKGKWLWKNFRGHVKGEPTAGKLGLSYGGPGLNNTGSLPKIMTIGGTTKSLEPYEIGKRTPIGKMGKFYEFEKAARQLKQFKRDPISMVQDVGINPPDMFSNFYKLIAKMTGKPMTLDVPSVAKTLAKKGSFKSGAQVIQGQQELRARNKLKKLQPGNIVQGVI